MAKVLIVRACANALTPWLGIAAGLLAASCGSSKDGGSFQDTSGSSSSSSSGSGSGSSGDGSGGSTAGVIIPIGGTGGSTGSTGARAPDDPPHANVPANLVYSSPGASPALPTDPSAPFGTTVDASRAPSIVYPNDGVMLPANLKRLEVHFTTGSSSNKLFQIDFSSSVGHVQVYLRCPNPVKGGGCVYELDPDAYASVAEPNRGGGPITVRVRGSDDAGTSYGESAPISISFSENYVLGGIYYWTTSQNTAIMRYDFGGTQSAPEVFMSPSTSNLPTCVGCHALSRDGKKIVASLGGQNDGRLVYVDDLNQDVFTLKGDSDNRAQFSSFNPTGDRFVSVYGDTSDMNDRNTLWFHDGTTGIRIAAESVVLPFEPDHPDWSPDGTMIAMTHVGIHQTSQRPLNCGIDLLPQASGSWGQPQTLVPIAPGLNRFNPTFAPDSSFLLYSESKCQNGDKGDDCDGDADQSAKTWAIAPQAGATPILLANAGAPGIADSGATDLADTFPRFAPFMQKNGQRLMWATISSRRQPGLRPLGNNGNGASNQLLWMFAIDPDKVGAGNDGSYPAFFLPFQDLTTSNHIAQWTQAIVGKPITIHVN